MSLLIWRWIVAGGLAAHGIAHAAGAAVAWRLTTSPEIPYHTTLLNGRFDVGDAGIRVIGLLWLGTACAFVAGAILLAGRSPSALIVIAAVSAASLVLCTVEWPFSQVGLIVDIVVLLALPAVGVLVWRSDSEDMRNVLRSSRSQERPADGSSRNALPEPVARYFSRVLPADRRAIRAVQLEQEAEFFVAGTWRPVRATQHFTVRPAGFLWDARISMLPFAVYVRDAYVQGKGSMRADFMAIYPMMRHAGRDELDAGALHRYLAEAVWFPTALLPSAGVRWEPVNDHAATATLTDGHTTVSLEFRFTEDGDVKEIFTPTRFAESAGRYEPRPWLVRCAEYVTHQGVRIPARCEVEWQPPSGAQSYWRGRVADVRYEFDDRSVSR